MPIGPVDEDQTKDEVDYTRLAVLLAQADPERDAYDVLRGILVQLAERGDESQDMTH